MYSSSAASIVMRSLASRSFRAIVALTTPGGGGTSLTGVVQVEACRRAVQPDLQPVVLEGGELRRVEGVGPLLRVGVMVGNLRHPCPSRPLSDDEVLLLRLPRRREVGEVRDPAGGGRIGEAAAAA